MATTTTARTSPPPMRHHLRGVLFVPPTAAAIRTKVTCRSAWCSYYYLVVFALLFHDFLRSKPQGHSYYYALAFSVAVVVVPPGRSNARRTTFFAPPSHSSSSPSSRLHLSDWRGGNNNNNNNNNGEDSNQWRSMSEDDPTAQPDWQDLMQRKNDGTFWSAFEPDNSNNSEEENPDDSPSSSSSDGTTTTSSSSTNSVKRTDEQDTEAWLDTIASLSAEEVEFNLKEADRADKVRQMQEWGFSKQAISSTLGVATDLSLEGVLEDQVMADMQTYREESYLDDVDLETVESHTRVEIEDETGEPVRNRMVYVDEHTCIGCTNCACIAQSTFFMHSEHGRARVFNQWGDDDETIQIAIETCPVDCIHYVPYDELVKLEVERRDQNINFKARLVSQGEYGGLGLSHRVGGPNAFTATQKISGNMGSRCNNCPSRGCRNCPMYGVGENPEFQRKEKERKERIAKRRLQEQREKEQKSVEL